MERKPASEIPGPSPTPSTLPKTILPSGAINDFSGKSQDEVRLGNENRILKALHLKGIWLPIPLFLIAICSLLLWKMPGSYESPYLLLALNFVFAMLASLLTAYLAFRAFLINGKPSSMILGCGLLIWGVNTVVATIFLSIGPNELVTVHNLGVFLSAFCHLTAAFLRWRSEATVNAPGPWLAAGITGTVGLTGVVAIAAVAGWTPVFFIPGSGGTTLRQVVLWMSIGMIALTVWLMGKEYRRSPSAFLHWYASGLSLIAVGLFGVMMQPIPGSIIGWLGRAAQLLGGAYILVAAFAAIQASRVWGLPLELVLRDTQAKLKDHIERYELVLAGASAALWDWDVPNKRVVFSPQWKALHGFDENEAIEQEKTLRESIHPEDREHVLAALQEHFDGKTAAFSEEYRIECRDGAVKWIFDRGLAKRDATGQVIRMAGSEIEITERKLAEQALKKNERRLSLAISATADAVWEWNMVTGETYYSPRWYEMLGYADGEIQMDFDGWKRLCHPDDFQPTMDLIQSRLDSSDDLSYEAEFRMLAKDGSWVWILGRGRVVERNAAGGPVLLSGTNTDISERKNAETALRRLSQFPEENPNPVLRIAVDGTLLYMNAPARQMLSVMGWRDGRPLPDHLTAAVAQAREQIRFVESEITIPCGRTFSLFFSQPLNEDYINLYGMDITERKLAEEKLRLNEARFRTLVEASSEVLYRMSPDWRDMRQLKGRGFLADTERPNCNWLQEYIHPDDQPQVNAAIDEAIRTRSAFVFEHRVRQADGTLGWTFSRSVPLLDAKGDVVEWFGAASDITARKQAEAALRESEAKYRDLFENMTEEVHFWEVVRDERGQIKTWRLVDANPPTLKTWDRKKVEEIIGKTTDEIFGPGATEHYLPVVQKIMDEGVPHAFEDYFPHLDKYFRFTSVPLEDHFITTGADITAIKKAEEAMRQRAEEVERLLEAVPAAVWVAHDPQCLTIIGNHKANEFYEVKPGENVSATILPEARRFFTPGGRELPAEELPMQKAIASNQDVLDTELHVELPSGRRIAMLGSAVPLRDPQGNARGCIGAFMDITDRKKSEEAIKASLSEKEVLLKEIHHRVKNNMQVISSLVDLQADEVKDDAVRGIFQDVIHRVRSMALVHEKLYQSADLSRVDFGDYAQSLLQYLWRAQGVVNDGVQLDLELESILMPVNAAVPCGLILNELFSNALKHAFRGREGGRVTVRLGQDGAGRVRLDVCDDGVGLPAGLDWRSAPSLGLRLVQMLARQLNAALELESADGTTFTITFEVHQS
jgi:PAS domain S-box-containing protein